jgi:hypothetical protein
MKEAVSALILTILLISNVGFISAQRLRGIGKIDRIDRIDRPVRPLPGVKTKFYSVEAYTSGSGVWLRWQMESESQNFGFYVYRLDRKGRQRVTDNVTAGTAMTPGHPTFGSEYKLFDPKGSTRSLYQIETIPIEGNRVTSNVFPAKYVSDLTTVGFDSDDLVLPKTNLNSSKVVETKLQPDEDLKAEINASLQAPDLDTQRWVASQPGVKIGVKKEGLYRVTRSQLEAAGFDVNTDPTLWQLYLNGVQQAIIVEGSGNYIEFYGKGLDIPQSDTATYYMVVGPTAGLRMTTRTVRPSLSTVVSRSYSQIFEKRDRSFYLDQVLNGDAENFFGGNIISTTNTYSMSFDLSSIDTSASTFTMDVYIQGFTFTPHPLSVTLNNQAIDPINGQNRDVLVGHYTLPTSMLIEGTNTLKVKSTAATTDLTLFDKVQLNYQRAYSSVQNALNFNSQNLRITRVDGFASANVRLFDITTDGSPVLMTGLSAVANGPTFSLKIPAARSRLFYAVEDSGLLQPASFEINNPSQLATQNHSAQQVIISYKDFITQANDWANYRAGQGITSEVIDVDDIFDEFSYGVRTADAIKSFLQYTRDNWQTAPNYVLLIGDATYDPRNYTSAGFINFVPVRIVQTVFTETGSDDFLADFDNDGLAEMAIGRIPASTPQVVADSLAKVMTFEQPALQTIDRGVLFASDVFDTQHNFSFEAMNTRISEQLPVGAPTTFVVKSETDSENKLITAMNAGQYAINYAGHGSSGTWSGTSFFSALNVDLCNGTHPCLTNANTRSIYTMLTCLNGFFFDPSGDKLAERLIKAPNGGAIVAWASTGETTPDVQEIMGKRFYLKLGEGQITRMGDLVLDAKSVIPGSSDVRLSWALLGDPMLKVHP